MRGLYTIGLTIALFTTATAVPKSAVLRHGEPADDSRGAHPTKISGWSNGVLDLNGGGTHFGFVFRGPAPLQSTSATTSNEACGRKCLPPKGWRVGPLVDSRGSACGWLLGGGRFGV